MYRTGALLLSLVLLATACGGDGPVEGVLEAVGLSENIDREAPPEPAEVDDVLGQMADDGFNGIVLIDEPSGLRVVPMGRVDGPESRPIDENTVFDIGSITKQFTGAAIARLEMDGLLSVDDRIGDHLVDIDGPLADVTLFQLLTHTAGLPGSIGDDYEQIDRAAFIERAMSIVDEPGEYEYSNVGYSLLGMVIETVGGQGYEAYLREVFFDPAGMDSTGYVIPEFDRADVAVGHDGDEALGTPDAQPWADDGPWWNLRANGGILSTAADMRRWNDALNGDEMLSAEAKEQLFGRHVEEGADAGTYYGYGWVSFPLDDGSWFHGHNGGNGIFFADVLRFAEDNRFIFLASNHAGADEDAAFRLGEVLVDGGVGAACLPPLDITAFDSTPDFPTTDAGDTSKAMVDALLEGDDNALRQFAETHVSGQLADGASIDEQVAQLAELQKEFVGYTVEMVHVEDAQRTHVAMASPSDGRVVLSLYVDATDPALITCVQIENP
ncbi:MAG: serine hydrolase domain-containing protein [Actinomycetota bacterium]